NDVGPTKLLHLGRVGGGVALGQQEFQRLAEHFQARPPKEPLGPPVEQNDLLLFVNRNDAVLGYVQNSGGEHAKGEVGIRSKSAHKSAPEIGAAASRGHESRVDEVIFASSAVRTRL